MKKKRKKLRGRKWEKCNSVKARPQGGDAPSPKSWPKSLKFISFCAVTPKNFRASCEKKCNLLCYANSIII